MNWAVESTSRSRMKSSSDGEAEEAGAEPEPGAPVCEAPALRAPALGAPTELEREREQPPSKFEDGTPSASEEGGANSVGTSWLLSAKSVVSELDESRAALTWLEAGDLAAVRFSRVSAVGS